MLLILLILATTINKQSSLHSYDFPKNFKKEDEAAKENQVKEPPKESVKSPVDEISSEGEYEEEEVEEEEESEEEKSPVFIEFIYVLCYRVRLL